MELEQKLKSIQGIGDNLVNELIKKGVKSKKDLLKKEIFTTLPISTQYYLKYKPKPISKEDISKIDFGMLNRYTIAGSYRRQKPVSSDIDIIIFHSIKNALKQLQTKYKLYVYSYGESKASFIMTIGKSNVKVDIFRTTHVEYPFMLLYLTGPQLFNIRVRARAKGLGYLLNQYGLYKNGKFIKCKNEKEILDKLNITWKEPHLRI